MSTYGNARRSFMEEDVFNTFGLSQNNNNVHHLNSSFNQKKSLDIITDGVRKKTCKIIDLSTFKKTV